MKLYEYQGKEVFKRYGIEVPESYGLIEPNDSPLDFDTSAFPSGILSVI